jgi:hypothetical protein
MRWLVIAKPIAVAIKPLPTTSENTLPMPRANIFSIGHGIARKAHAAVNV